MLRSHVRFPQSPPIGRSRSARFAFLSPLSDPGLATGMTHNPFNEVDEQRLESDILYRFRYLAHFMNFDEADIRAIEEAAPALDPHVDAIVHDVYHRLFQHDATLRHFMHRQHGLEGASVSEPGELSLSHVQIRFRMTHLAGYLRKIMNGPYDEKLIGYLDFVGRMHTSQAGNPLIHVPAVQITAFMGYLCNKIVELLHRVTLTSEQRLGALEAMMKVLWIQHDLMMRHQIIAARDEARPF
jgi:hypothetical protein